MTVCKHFSIVRALTGVNTSTFLEWRGDEIDNSKSTQLLKNFLIPTKFIANEHLRTFDSLRINTHSDVVSVQSTLKHSATIRPRRPRLIFRYVVIEVTASDQQNVGCRGRLWLYYTSSIHPSTDPDSTPPNATQQPRRMSKRSKTLPLRQNISFQNLSLAI